MTTVSIRVDEKVKKEANETFAALGIDMSSAVKMFLHQVIIEQGIPFKPTRTSQQVKALYDAGVVEALKKGKRYTDVDEMFADITKESH